MIYVENYKAFRGTMQIVPRRLGELPELIYGDWLYKPDTQCWYCNGRYFSDQVCQVVEDLTEGL